MTAAVPSLSSAPARSAAPTARGGSVSQTVRAARFAAASARSTLSKGMFLFFTIALPVVMFCMFNALYGKEQAGGTTVGTVIMVHMAAYGGLGAAISSGAIIQLERANGWLRQLMVAGLTPGAFVVGKMAAALAVVLPALLGVYLAGWVIGDVHMSAAQALVSLLVLWASMVPIILLGLALGLALRPSAVQPASTIGMMVLAVVGGLWFPAEMFPQWMRTVAHGVPTYWIGELGTWAVAGGDVPVRGIAVLGGWTVALAAVSALLLRRAARTSSRR